MPRSFTRRTPPAESMLTIRRDYRDILPALRHRYDPANAALARFQQPHDVHLTIDADLQLARCRNRRGLRPEERRPGCGRRARSGQRRAAGERQLSVARELGLTRTCVRGFGASTRRARGRPIGKRDRLVPGSRALRLVSAWIDVQAGHGIGGAASACRSAQDHVHLRAAAGRKSGRENQRLEPPGSRRRAWMRIRTGRSTCTTASCIRATPTSRSSPSSSDRGRCSTPPTGWGFR